MSDANEWTFDDAARARADAEIARIDRSQADCPKCVVCGQRANRLDKAGTCSKTSDVHLAHRAEVKARADRAEARTASGVGFR